jgi:NADH-quinone oxidoreductase subunit F
VVHETGSPKELGHQGLLAGGQSEEHRLVEMPLGTPLKTFIYDIGEGGLQDGR